MWDVGWPLLQYSIRHPNIVQFLGFVTQMSPVMVMELMSTSLTNFVESKKSQIAFKKKISILYNVSLGLSYVSSQP